MFLYPQMTKPHIIKYLTDVVVQHNGIRISETQQEQMEQGTREGRINERSRRPKETYLATKTGAVCTKRPPSSRLRTTKSKDPS